MASMLKQLAGGRALYRDPTPASTWARHAEGGVVSSNAMHLPSIRTGGVPLAPASAIDYEQLGQVLARHLTPSFVTAARALTAPVTNLTELREKRQQIEQRDTLPNI